MGHLGGVVRDELERAVSGDGDVVEIPHELAQRTRACAVEVELVLREQHERRCDSDLLGAEDRGRQRQKTVRLVTTQDVEAERAVADRVHDHVDRTPDLDAFGSNGEAEKVAGRDAVHS